MADHGSPKVNFFVIFEKTEVDLVGVGEIRTFIFCNFKVHIAVHSSSTLN